jgi:hypothetical protein
VTGKIFHQCIGRTCWQGMEWLVSNVIEVTLVSAYLTLSSDLCSALVYCFSSMPHICLCLQLYVYRIHGHRLKDGCGRVKSTMFLSCPSCNQHSISEMQFCHRMCNLFVDCSRLHNIWCQGSGWLLVTVKATALTLVFLLDSRPTPKFLQGCSSKQGRTDISLRISQCVLKGWQL